MPPLELGKQCKAIAKNSGTRCTQRAVRGFNVCRFHGANPNSRVGAPKGNKNRLAHGAYVKKLLSEDEYTLFEQTIKELYETFDLNRSSDAMVTVMCAFNFVRWYRALAAVDEELQMKYRREVLSLLESLKATRDKREGTTVEIKTPAEWAADLLARVREGK